jgi:peptidoglycan/xylan/chitin deacetylase (PgdA/CDA1 family)
MRIHLELTGLALWLMASGLTACTAQTSVSAGQLIAPTSTSTLLPVATATSTVMTIARVPTRTPSLTPAPTTTATAQPTATEEPVQQKPTAVLTPIPIAPPEPDGVLRSADAPILMYHYISTAPSAQDRIRYGLSVSPEMFEAQLKLLRDNGFTTITLRQLYEYLAIGTPLPEKPVILTFDDGYNDNYTNAFQSCRSTTCWARSCIDRPGGWRSAYLTWDMITEMSNAGMDIQLHSREHLDMRNRPYDWLVFQIIGGRQSIEGHTGKPVIFMAYPSGKYDATVQRFLRDTNFWAAVTTAFGSRHVLQNALIWDRVRVSGQLRLQDFAKLLGIPAVPPRGAPRLTATLQATQHPSNAAETLTPIATLTNPLPTFTATNYPTQTPAASPTLSPTSVQSPLATPLP